MTVSRDTGLADILAEHRLENLVLVDLRYLGEPIVTPVKKPPKGELLSAQTQSNKYPSGIRATVERHIAHLKNWKMTSHRTSPSPTKTVSLSHCLTVSPQQPNLNSTASAGPLLNKVLRTLLWVENELS
jgi:hypothetical protein